MNAYHPATAPVPAAPGITDLASHPAVRHVVAITACVVLTAAIYPLDDHLDHANIVMAYLLAVAVVARTFGRNPAIVSTVASVLLFDFFFVDPRFSFAVADAQFLITFGVMLAVALMIGTLTARLREEADAATLREAQTAALYGLARDLSGALTIESVGERVAEFVHGYFGLDAALALPDRADALRPVFVPHGHALDWVVPIKVFQHGEPETYIDRHSGNTALALPLVVGEKPRGVLVVSTANRDSIATRGERSQLDAVATLTGIVIERLHYVEVAHEATLQAETQQLRNSLLSAVSHDLRTPLTVLVGLADTLANAKTVLPPEQAETATIIRDEALRLTRWVTDLLEMARLQAGRVVLRKEWQPLEDVVLTSVRAIEPGLPRGRRIVIELPADLPLVEFDAVLIERVVTNLLDNAARHGRGVITVGASARSDAVEVEVTDEGEGIPPGEEPGVFRVDERQGDRRGGSGMGLAICRAIVEAHSGAIRAGRTPSGRARLTFTLPLGRPPSPQTTNEADAGDAAAR